MKRANALLSDRKDWSKRATAKFAAALIVSSSILPQAALAQSVTVGSSDVDGPDDEQAQSDLTSFELTCPATGATDLPLSVQLDPVANSGGNSSDISILFDTDGDGNANYSYVVTLGNDPFSVIDIQLQQGRNDSSLIKISGNKTDLPIGTTTSSTSIGINPFNGDDDTLVSLNLDLSAIATHAGISVDDIQFVNITTIPSSSATSDPKDILLATTQAFTSDDSGSTDVSSTIAIDSLGNDSSKIDWSTAQIVTQPTHGTVSINADGTINYVPNGDYTGIDTFSYSAVATDCTTYTSNVTVTITGIAANDETTTVTSSATGSVGVLNVRDNDIIDGAATTSSNTTLSIASTSSLPSQLTFDSSSGEVGVVPNAPAGTYSFDYEICRGDDPTYCRIATATVIVEAQEVDLSIAKTNGTSEVTSGSTTTYTLTVTHNSGDPINGAIVSDAPGAGITCAASAPVTITGDGVPAGSFTFADLSGSGIALGTLTAGQSTTLTYTCDVN